MQTQLKRSRVENPQAFLQEARELYAFGLSADRIDRTAAEDDNAFANAADADKGQWDRIPFEQRKEANRPILQWNRIPTYVQQVVNDGRQNKPAIKVSPADGGQAETAEFFQSRIRHIEYECNADIAYDTARDQQVTSGRGFIRVSVDWEPGTWKQRACIDPIDNQFSVVIDPSAQRYDRSDAEWMFVVTRLSREKHKREYGEESLVNRMDFSSIDGIYRDWIGVGDAHDMVQIAEYWRKEYRKRKLLAIQPQGELAALGELPIWDDEVTEDMRPWLVRDSKGEPRERWEQDASICQYIINGAEILDETDWIGSTIPIVPVWGRTAVVEGKRRTFSLIRNAKDPQRLVNLYVSNIAEQIAMMPKAPYEAPVGAMAANSQIEQAWQNAGTNPKAILYYNQYDVNGLKLDRPSRVVSEPPIQALSEGLQQAIYGVKEAMGIFDASLGNRSNEVSGVAISQRRKSADILNFHFPDNEARSRKRIGQILVEIIPKIDKPGSSVPVRSIDGKTRHVPIGQPHQDAKTGREVTHVLTDGDYGVTVSTGPTQESARRESFERDTALIQANPALMMIFGDLMFAADDTPGSEERAERMKKAIQIQTPQLIEDPNQQEAIPPKVAAIIQKLQQEAMIADKHAQQLFEQIQTKQHELDNAVRLKQMELEAKAQETDKELDFKREELAEKARIELAKLGSGADIVHLEQEIDSLKHEHSLAQERFLELQKLGSAIAEQASDQGHKASQAEADRQHQASESGAERAHASEMADKGHAQTLEAQQQAADLAPEPAKTSE